MTALLIRAHLDRYPALEIMDIYKLLYQATFGIGHPVVKKDIEREWLEHEFSISTPNANELLLENISVDNSLRRLHLRPYIAAGGRLDPLMEAVIRSAAVVKGEAKLLAERWSQFETMVAQEPRLQERMPLRDVNMIGRIQRENNWSAVPHTPAYIAAYNPIYRVLTTTDAEAVCRQQNIKI